MSLLTPLYLLGGLAIALPILVHLIRRRPKAKAEFSSLMFLRESPPQLTKRSRLDDWPLLLLRALAIGLLAIAFARPYWRSEETRTADASGRRFVLLVDTSASMRRSGIQDAVQERINAFADGLEPGDSVACLLFDATPKVAIDFEQTAKLDFAARQDLIRDFGKGVEPTWWGTDLGAAISFAADHASHQVADSPVRGNPDDTTNAAVVSSVDSSASVHLVVVSDLQQGSQTGALQSFVWPDNVTAELQPVTALGKTNASIRLLQQSQNAATSQQTTGTDALGGRPWKVRVQNSADATETQFTLHWADATGHTKRVAAENVQCVAGQTRVIEVEPPLPGDETITIDGDDHSFDNAIYVVTPEQRKQRLVFLGNSVDNVSEDPSHYLKLIPLDNARRSVEFVFLEPNVDAVTLPGADDVDRDALTVIATPPSSEHTARLKQYLRSGGKVVAVMSSGQAWPGWSQSITEITDVPVTVEDATVDDYALWSEIDFRDPLFHLMADPQFSDFSNLRFWSHRTITAGRKPIDEEFDVVVRFDDGDPAILRRSVGRGTLILMTCGWQPSESQLALSTKFIPLAFQLFDAEAYAASSRPQSIDLMPGAANDWFGQRSLPTDSSTFELAGTWGTENVPGTNAVDRPGILRYREGTDSATPWSKVAVNVLGNESRTEPLDPATLESQGLVLGKPTTSAERSAKQKQLRDVELEDSQGWWRIILAATLGMLAMETAWSGRRRRDRTASEGN